MSKRCLRGRLQPDAPSLHPFVLYMPCPQSISCCHNDSNMGPSDCVRTLIQFAIPSDCDPAGSRRLSIADIMMSSALHAGTCIAARIWESHINQTPAQGYHLRDVISGCAGLTASRSVVSPFVVVVRRLGGDCPRPCGRCAPGTQVHAAAVAILICEGLTVRAAHSAVAMLSRGAPAIGGATSKLCAHSKTFADGQTGTHPLLNCCSAT